MQWIKVHTGNTAQIAVCLCAWTQQKPCPAMLTRSMHAQQAAPDMVPAQLPSEAGQASDKLEVKSLV